MNPFCEENTWELSQENDNGIEYETKSGNFPNPRMNQYSK